MLEEAIKNENFINSFAGMHPASISRGFQAVLFDSQLMPLSHDWTLEQTQQLGFGEKNWWNWNISLQKSKENLLTECTIPLFLSIECGWKYYRTNEGRKSKFLKASRNLKEFPQRKSTINENITGSNRTKKTVDRKKSIFRRSKWTASE